MLVRRVIIIGILSVFGMGLMGQGPHNRAVEVSAVVQENPPAINFSWPFDWSEGGYKIYKKNPSDADWGMPVDELPFGALGWSDTDIQVGTPYEYAFFKKEKEYLRDTILVAGGTDVTFSIYNIQLRNSPILWHKGNFHLPIFLSTYSSYQRSTSGKYNQIVPVPIGTTERKVKNS